MGIANGAHINTQQFKLGAHISTLKRLLVVTQLADGSLCHTITWSYQTKDAATKQSTFTNGKNI